MKELYILEMKYEGFVGVCTTFEKAVELAKDMDNYGVILIIKPKLNTDEYEVITSSTNNYERN